MTKTIKKLVMTLMVFGVLLSLVGCLPSKDLTFKNSLNSNLTGIHLSLSEKEEWGEKINQEHINKGKSFSFNFSDLGTDMGPGVYDLGTIDEDAMNYDVYELELKEGDTIELTCIGETAVAVVTHKDGSTTRYEGITYPNE